MHKIKARRHGFTLIEILVVITIISVLSGVGIFSYTNAQKAARDAKRRADLHSLRIALESYYAANGTYPVVASWSGEPSAYGSHTTDYVPGLAPNYIDKLPNDPRANTSYAPCSNATYTGYLYYSNGTDFKLMAHCSPEGVMSNSKDPYYDPVRPSYTWQISTPGGAAW